MRIRGYRELIGAVVLALSLVALTGLYGQAKPGAALAPPAAPAQPALPTAPVSPAPAAPLAVREDCDDQAVAEKEAEQKLESAQQELESKMKLLEEQMAREVAAMDARRLGKLDEMEAALQGKMAQLESNKDEIERRAQVMAQELAQESMSGAWVVDVGEESGWLGVEIAEVDADKAKELKLPAVRGVLIVDVEPDSPAAKAGLKANDVIAEYDGQAVEGVVQFRRLVRETPPGRSIPIAVWREGNTLNMTVAVGDRGKAKAGRMKEMNPRVFGAPDFNFDLHMPEFFFGAAPMLGINAEDLSGQLGAYFGAPGGEGVLVREVRPNTPAEKAGLKAGDVILKVDDHPVKTVGELRDQLREKADQKAVKLTLLRKGSEMNANVELEPPKQHDHPHVIRRSTL
jgi:serine protease Do